MCREAPWGGFDFYRKMLLSIVFVSMIASISSAEEAAPTSISDTDEVLSADEVQEATAEASEVTCTPESPQCCWVVRIWKLMGKSTLVDHTSATACCSMSGVTCSGSTVTKIYWSFRGITGCSIPPDVGNLVNLTFL
jgi:hypothetical protein